jgi:DNA-binding transcriptional ArsR family regulator
MRDELVLETTEQIRALAHPLRQRVLHLLTDVPYTNKQLAMALQVSPPRLHFHVRELQAAGLIEIVSEQPQKGSHREILPSGSPDISVEIHSVSRVCPRRSFGEFT